MLGQGEILRGAIQTPPAQTLLPKCYVSLWKKGPPKLALKAIDPDASINSFHRVAGLLQPLLGWSVEIHLHFRNDSGSHWFHARTGGSALLVTNLTRKVLRPDLECLESGEK